VDAALNLTRVAEESGDLAYARQVLGECLTFRPHERRLLDALARLEVMAGEPRSSLARLKALLRLAEEEGWEGEKRARVLNNIGVAYVALGDLEKAREHFILAGKGGTSGIPARNLARVLFRAGRPEEAAAIAASSLERDPKDSEALLMMAHYHVRTGEVTMAERESRRAIALDSKDWRGHAVLSSLLADEFERYDEAINILKTGLLESPDSVPLKNNLAYVLLMKGAREEARRVLNSITEVAPREELYLAATRGLLEIHDGRLDEGRRLYNRAARLAGDEGTRNLVLQKKALELAKAYERLGNQQRPETS
jgi:Flp pilus assembly protein TadD